MQHKLFLDVSRVADLFLSAGPTKKAHKTWLKNSRRNVSDRTCACGIAHQRTHEIPAHGYTDTKFNADDTAGRVQKLLSNQKNNTKIRKRYKDRPE